MSTRPGALNLLVHPYDRTIPLSGGRATLRSVARRPGSALVWSISGDLRSSAIDLVAGRPGGLALIVVLPPADAIAADPTLIPGVQRCRPQSVLPSHSDPDARDLSAVLRKPPFDLAAEVTDYLSWRGLTVDRETTHLLRRIIELSAELRSITSLSRSMYLSRRALGRRLMNEGLPVPSHWLQVGRLLRLTSRLQNSDASLFSLACDEGYPDGFSVSNQMYRLTGYRPSQVRQYLGWEWLLEAWLRREAETGGLSPGIARSVTHGSRSSGKGPTPAKPLAGRPTRSRRSSAT